MDSRYVRGYSGRLEHVTGGSRTAIILLNLPIEFPFFKPAQPNLRRPFPVQRMCSLSSLTLLTIIVFSPVCLSFNPAPTQFTPSISSRISPSSLYSQPKTVQSKPFIIHGLSLPKSTIFQVQSKLRKNGKMLQCL